MVGSSYAWICQGQSLFMPRRTIIHVVNLPTYSELILHYLSCYPPSSPTGLLLTLQNTVHPPTSVHLHCSFIEGYFPLPIYLLLLLFVLQSQLKYHLLREIASSLPDRDDRPLVNTFLYVSSIALITDLMIRTGQPQQIKLLLWSGSSLYLWYLAQGLTPSIYLLNEWMSKLQLIKTTRAPVITLS